MHGAVAAASLTPRQLTIVEQKLHTRHRPPPGVAHVEVPERLTAARDALSRANICENWLAAGEGAYSHAAALRALCAVHTAEHLEAVQRMSLRGGGFDTDTYCAPGSWEAMLDGTSAWLEATALAAAGEGPALALSRPAGHHATPSVAMGFGLVNFAAAAVAAHLEAHPSSRVAILDWDVHHGNGVAAIFCEEPRVRYASTHEAGGFPQTGMREEERGPLGNLLQLPLSKGAGGDVFLAALRQKALPFLLAPTPPTAGGEDVGIGKAPPAAPRASWDRPPELLVICAGYDALDADPLATMSLGPDDFAAAVRMILDDFGYPAAQVALGLEGGYDLDPEVGMPAGLVATCRALVER